MRENQIEAYRTRLRELEEIRKRSVEDKAVDVSEYICPARGRFSDTELEPDRSHRVRGKKILDPTGQRGLRTAQNGMHSGLTPPSRPWLRLVFSDPDLNEFKPAKEWRDALQDRIYSFLRQSNWYSAVHSLYAEIIAFSTGVLYQERDAATVVRYRPLTFGEYWIAQDDRARVDTLYRKLQLSAGQLVRAFGESNVSQPVKSALKDKRDTPFLVIHAVQPRSGASRNPSKADNRNMPWESTYFENAGDRNEPLSQSGYERFPFVVCRYNTVGNDVYGCEGPGFETLPDVRMLQDMVETIMRQEHKAIDPPLRAPTSLKGLPIRTGAGGVTFYDSTDPAAFAPLYQVQFRIAESIQEAQRVRESILSGFYHDIFLMVANDRQSNVTATEILEKQAEKLLQLGPFIEKLQDELLDPALEFLVSEILIRGLVPQPPREIQGAQYKFEYISLLAQAQKEVGTRQIDQNVQFALSVAQGFPEALDVIDIRKAIRERADITGLPAKIIRTDDEIQAILDRKQQMMQQQQAAQEAMQMAQGAKTLAQTPTDPNQPNALTDLIGAMQQ